jgi:hypothetical protein
MMEAENATRRIEDDAGGRFERDARILSTLVPTAS